MRRKLRVGRSQLSGNQTRPAHGEVRASAVAPGPFVRFGEIITDRHGEPGAS